MRNADFVTGTVTDERTVTLDEALPVASVKVRLVLEPLAPTVESSPQEALSLIRERQRSHGYSPPTREQVDVYLGAEQNSYNRFASPELPIPPVLDVGYVGDAHTLEDIST